MNQNETEYLAKIIWDYHHLNQKLEKGFQIPQEIPTNVWNAYEKLVKAGYTKHLIKEH